MEDTFVSPAFFNESQKRALKRVCVPIDSPAWTHYIDQGYVTIAIQGTWATLLLPQPSPADIASMPG